MPEHDEVSRAVCPADWNLVGVSMTLFRGGNHRLGAEVRRIV